MTALLNQKPHSDSYMKSSVAITILLWFATIALFIPSVTADEEFLGSKANRRYRRLVARSDDEKIFYHPGHLRKQKETAQEDKGFTLWDFDAIEAMVPEYTEYKSSRAWPILVATVSDGKGNPTYYTAPMPSGVKPDLNYFLNFGQRHGDLDSLSTAISNKAVKTGNVLEWKNISSPMQGLINYWGRGDLSKGNCYRYAANDTIKCYKEHFERPGDMDFTSLTPSSTCEKLIAYSIEDGMGLEPYYLGDVKVAVVAAFDDSSNKFLDFHWYRQMDDGTWTHKPGSTEVSDTDASGKKITNPKACNRNYGELNYKYFCGYLYVPGGMIDLDMYKNDTCADFPPLYEEADDMVKGNVSLCLISPMI
jgi:hypothetical protein